MKSLRAFTFADQFKYRHTEWNERNRVVVFVGEYLQEVPLRQEAKRRRQDLLAAQIRNDGFFLHIFRTASMCARKAALFNEFEKRCGY